MSSWSEVSLGGMGLEGAAREIPFRYGDLFNSEDLVTTGKPEDDYYQRAYRIAVPELRRRLEMIGATVAASTASFRAVIEKEANGARDIDTIHYASFFRYAKSLTDEDLVRLVKEAYDRRNDPPDFGQFDTDFDKNVVRLLQGDTCLYLDDNRVPLWNGYAFEALACTFLDDVSVLELNITHLVDAGYYDEYEDPVGNAFDRRVAGSDPDMLVLGNVVDWEESEECEFKSVRSANPVSTIRDLLARYVIAFMNQTGGQLFFGIDDNGTVEGIRLDRRKRDELSRALNQELATITPKVALDGIQIRYRPVVGSAHIMDDTFVVEIKVPQGPPHEMHFRSNDTWVRFGTESKKLQGHDLFVHVLAAYRTVMQPRDRATPPDATLNPLPAKQVL